MARTKSSRKRCWCISISVVIVLIIIAIVVPIAVVLSRRGIHGKASTVLLPLYIYPKSNTSWSPLYDALEARPELKFTVIVNPSSGPGSSPFPNDQYITALQKLNQYPNVKTVGYVRTGYATRNIADVTSEISTYAGWASKSSSLAMYGIFLDEAPHEYSAAAVEYMRSVNRVVKNATGLQGDKTVIHNPGTIPDSRFSDSNTDITVVFEDSFSAYQTALTSLTALPKRRSEYSFMINSVPAMGTGDLRNFIDRLSQLAEFLFITDSEQDFYEKFGTQWANFTSVVPA